MSYNSKYTGAQVEERLDSIPTKYVKAEEAIIEGIEEPSIVEIFGSPLDEYETYTIVTESGEIVTPPEEGGGGEEQDDSYADIDNLILWIDAIKQIEDYGFSNYNEFKNFSDTNVTFESNKLESYYPDTTTYFDTGKSWFCIKESSFLSMLDSGFTIEWVFQRKCHDWQGNIVTTNNNDGMLLGGTTGDVRLLRFDTTYKNAGVADMSNDKITHVTLTHSSSGDVKIYVDGELKHTTTDQFTPSEYWSGGMWIGGYGTWIRVMSASINSIRIYKSVLTDKMIEFNKSIDDARFGNVNIAE